MSIAAATYLRLGHVPPRSLESKLKRDPGLDDPPLLGLVAREKLFAGLGDDCLFSFRFSFSFSYRFSFRDSSFTPDFVRTSRNFTPRRRVRVQGVSLTGSSFPSRDMQTKASRR